MVLTTSLLSAEISGAFFFRTLALSLTLGESDKQLGESDSVATPKRRNKTQTCLRKPFLFEVFSGLQHSCMLEGNTGGKKPNTQPHNAESVGSV